MKRLQTLTSRPDLTVVATAMTLLAAVDAFAQTSPFERPFMNIASLLTGPMSRTITIIAICIAGFGAMGGDPGVKRSCIYVIIGGVMVLFAGQVMNWLF